MMPAGLIVERETGTAGRDRGAALLVTVVATLMAASIGLVAVLAVMRSLATEGRSARQETVERLAGDALEEAFGRLVLAESGLAAVREHPAHGPVGDEAPVAGPWVRIGTTGQLLDCDDAREPCYTLRSLTDTDLADAEADAATVAVLEATARWCRTESADGCVWARRQMTVRARPFAQHVLWVGSAADATFVGDAGQTPPVVDQVVGDVHVLSGSVVVCGDAEVAVDTGVTPAATYRIETVDATSVALRSGCSAPIGDAEAGVSVSNSDALALPAPDAESLAAIAELGGISVEQGAQPVQISFSDVVEEGGAVRTQVSVDGTVSELPANGLIHVDGEAELTGGAPVRGRLTVAATGDVTISGGLQVWRDAGDPGSRMIGVVSIGGNIDIAFADGTAQQDLTLDAVLVATGCIDDGAGGCTDAAGVVGAVGDLTGCEAVVEPTDEDPDPVQPAVPCVVAELAINGAIVARELAPVADASSAGVIQRGFVKAYRHDERLAWMQPPWALEAVRGNWIRVDAAPTAPLGPGLGAAVTTTTTP